MLSNFLFYQNVEQLPALIDLPNASLKGVVGETRGEKLGDEEFEEELAFGFARE